jgi:hypothetical protein
MYTTFPKRRFVRPFLAGSCVPLGNVHQYARSCFCNLPPHISKKKIPRVVVALQGIESYKKTGASSITVWGYNPM